MRKLNVSEGVFCALAQCVEEVRALVPVSSEGGVAICNGCLSVCEGGGGWHTLTRKSNALGICAGYKLQYTSSIKQCFAIHSPHRSSDVYLPPAFICWWTTLPMAAHRPRFRVRSVSLNTGALASIAYTHRQTDRQRARWLVLKQTSTSRSEAEGYLG